MDTAGLYLKFPQEMGPGLCALQPMMRPAAMAGTSSSSSHPGVHSTPVGLMVMMMMMMWAHAAQVAYQDLS